MDSYGENKKEEKNSRIHKRMQPTGFYFKELSITEEGFLDISSKTLIRVLQFFSFYMLASLPLPPPSILLCLGKQIRVLKTGSCRRRGDHGLLLNVRCPERTYTLHRLEGM